MEKSMALRWKVIVNNFGKIKNAEIDVSKLVLFVGENNSGKSYLLTLLWGLLDQESRTILLRPSLSENIKEYSEEYFKLTKWIAEIIDKPSQKKYKVTKDIHDAFNTLLNYKLKDSKDNFVKSLFNADVQIGELKIEFSFDYNIALSFEYYNLNKPIEIDNQKEPETVMWIEHKNTKKGILVSGKNDIAVYVNFFINIMANTLIMDICKKPIKPIHGESIVPFLPSSRTGFLLSKNFIANKLIMNNLNKEIDSQVENNSIESGYFAKPVTKFLTLMNNLKASTMMKNIDVINLIEEKLIKGQLEINEASLNNQFVYKPKNSKAVYQMYLSSAVITEIAPLYLLLKHQNAIDCLMIEEPEMCMHPEFQYIMARVLIQISNLGIPVFATTHSELIIQHVNNMIKAKRSKEVAYSMGYKDSDFIDSDDVSIYQFQINKDNKTDVTKLLTNEYGFDVPTFNNVLLKILKETEALQGGNYE